MRKNARFLTIEEIKSIPVQELIQIMYKTVHGRGVGLAAPQIGYSLQIAVVEDLEEYISSLPIEVREERERDPVPFYVLINPKIIWLDKEEASFFEGCLSISDKARIVPRAKRITVSYLDEQGENHIITAKGWHARILQHEIGHLNKTLYIDVSDSRTEVTMDEYKNHWVYARSSEIQKFYCERMQ